jgi:hypothetical protein
MVEIEECKHCGNCCYYRLDNDGCLFLDFDQKNSQFSCLIYKNRARSRIDISSIEGLLDQNPENYEKSLEKLYRGLRWSIINDYKGCCYTYDCPNQILHGTKSFDIRTSEEHRLSAISFQKKAEEFRKIIPDFAVLVEMLNEYVPNFVDLVEIE